MFLCYFMNDLDTINIFNLIEINIYNIDISILGKKIKITLFK